MNLQARLATLEKRENEPLVTWEDFYKGYGQVLDPKEAAEIVARRLNDREFVKSSALLKAALDFATDLRKSSHTKLLADELENRLAKAFEK